MDSLDINDRFYNQKYADMEERLNDLYEHIESVDNDLAILNLGKTSTNSKRLTTNLHSEVSAQIG